MATRAIKIFQEKIQQREVKPCLFQIANYKWDGLRLIDPGVGNPENMEGVPLLELPADRRVIAASWIPEMEKELVKILAHRDAQRNAQEARLKTCLKTIASYLEENGHG